MTTLYRYRAVLSGFSGGPGVSTMYFLDQQTAMASVRSFWNTMSGIIPNTVTINVQNSGDIIESTTGALTGAWNKPAVLSVTGQGVDSYSAPSGLCVTWDTAGIVNRRRLRGRTFVVPATAGAYALDGTLTPAAIAFAAGAAQALIFEQSLSLVIWSRPFAGSAATPTTPARPARAGSHSLVTTARVADKAAVLRSRRD